MKRRLTAAVAFAAALVLLAASPASAHTSTTARSGEGVIRIVQRVCGTSQGWQQVAAENGITAASGYRVLRGQTLSVGCPSGASAAPAPSSGWVHPLPGRCGRNFGWRVHPISGVWKMHHGADFGAPFGTPVRAAHAGTARHGYQAGGAGIYVTVQGSDGVGSTYFHMSSRAVGDGAHVNAGQTIGYVGSTGASTGPHLHLEVHPWGLWQKRWSNTYNTYTYTNPVTWLRNHGVAVC